jgi:hypothetical protein
LFDDLSAALFQDDPVGINFESNTNEYEPEVGTILPRLKNCASVADVKQVLLEEFRHWFGADAPPAERIENLAAEVWRLWSRHVM